MTEVETERIINEIRGYPELYLMGHPDYKNSYKKEVAWRKIEGSTGLDVKSLKAKWKNLRDTYKKYKQSQLTFSGQAAKKYANWVWAEHMSYVDSTTNLRSTESTLNTSPPKLQAAENNKIENLLQNPTDIEERVEPIIGNETQQEAQDDGSVSNISETGSDLYRRRRRRNLDPSDKIINYLEKRKIAKSSTPNTGQNLVNVLCDRLDMTFLGFADSVKKLSLNNQAIIKLQVMKLITEYELKEITSDNRPNSSNSTYVSTPESITLDDLSNHSNRNVRQPSTSGVNYHNTLSNTQSQTENRDLNQPSTSGVNTHNNIRTPNIIILQSSEISDQHTSQIITDEKSTQKYIMIQPSDQRNDNKENNYLSAQSCFANWNE
ncbi:uncharacterized protein LOC124641256 [Helicoverpa zea]|uniref:uncharacterized protein LOC124641256 n=1 Tax=Helicoverpa zea TaxID=7113 RepID=UPI001F577F66|nr:uncharacterized protein LOC124641256 [Helicoverpa zea]